MKRISFIKVFVLALVASTFALRAKADPNDLSTSGVSTIIFPSKMISTTDAPIRVDTGNIESRQIGRWFAQVKEFLPSESSMRVHAYVPDGLSPDAEQKFADFLRNELRPTYPNAPVDIIRVRVAEIASQIIDANRQLESEKSQNHHLVSPEVIEGAVQENKQTLENLKSWKSGFSDFLAKIHTPQSNLLIGNILSKTRGVLGGALLVTGAGLNWFSAAAALMETLVVYQTNRIGIRQQDFVNEKLRIPIAKNFPLVRIFNSSMFVRSVFYGFAVWNFSYRSLKKGLVYLGDPTRITSPFSSAGLWETVTVGGFSSVIGAFGGTGISSLGNKGYLSKMSQNYLLWSIGLIGAGFHLN